MISPSSNGSGRAWFPFRVRVGASDIRAAWRRGSTAAGLLCWLRPSGLNYDSPPLRPACAASSRSCEKAALPLGNLFAALTAGFRGELTILGKAALVAGHVVAALAGDLALLVLVHGCEAAIGYLSSVLGHEKLLRLLVMREPFSDLSSGQWARRDIVPIELRSTLSDMSHG
jgi:hypothetical protein